MTTNEAYAEQHARDSKELSRLCGERDSLKAERDTLRAQLEAAEAELATHRRDRELYVLITTQEADQWQSAEARAEAAEARCARISEAIDLAFDAAASDLEANKAEYEFDHINGAYYGLCLMRMEINKARTKEQQA